MSNNSSGMNERAMRQQRSEHGEGQASLRAAVMNLVTTEDWTGTRQWEAIGAQLLALAERDSQSWPDNTEEYRSAYLVAAIDLLRRRLPMVQTADEPVALIVRVARFSGQNAVLAERCAGLTDRDASTHRTRLSSVPSVCSIDLVNEHHLAADVQPVAW